MEQTFGLCKTWYGTPMHLFVPRHHLSILVAAALLLAGCSRTTSMRSEPTQQPAADVQLPDGFMATVYASGLHSPTALAWGEDNALFVTQLNGGENAGTGQVVQIDSSGAAPVVVLDNIRKPTGLAWRDQHLYVVAGRDVLRTERGTDGTYAPPKQVVRDLPFNGRSEGQVDLLPDGRLVFETSGSVGNEQSGRMLALGDNDQPSTVATGLKNAYGYAYDARNERLFTTEIGDDRMDGKAPPDEINLVVADGDYGWPRCYDDRIPARDRGADETICATTRTPVVQFAPGATPTGLAFYDRDDVPPEYRGALYVAIWNGTPTVERITLTGEGEAVRGTASTFMRGKFRPIDVLVHPDGGMLILDFDGGVVYLVRATR